MKIRPSILPAALLAVALAAPAGAAAPTLLGKTSCAWGSRECNRCVPNVHGELANLRDRGDISGFHMNFARDVSSSNHWQGVQRLHSSGGRYLIVSRSGSGVAFVVAHLQSRDGDGRRFRSNRLSPNTFAWMTPPAFTDGVAAQVFQDWGFDHAGGIQAVGDIVAVPLENPNTDRSRVVFWDLVSPASPQRLFHMDHSNPATSSSPGNAGAAAITKLQDGRYLLLVAGHDSGNFDFYVSNTTSLLDPNVSFERFTTRSGLGYPFQNLNFVTQCDGKIFLVGTYNTHPAGWGSDWVRWYRIANGFGNSVAIYSYGSRHMYCSYPSPPSGNVQHCDYVAAAGTYVDPDGRLLIYSTEHDNDGPFGSVKFEEFRGMNPSPCATISDAWVELYDDDNYRDRGVMIDYVDRNLRNYDNYDRVEDFEDRTSSARWCIPPGWRYRLYSNKNSCGGSYRDLTGSGSEHNFKDIGFGDKVSCSRWLPW